MRVAIDGRTLQGPQRGGVGRGLANLLPHLADHVDVTLLLDERRGLVDGPAAEVVSLRAPTRHGSVWLETTAARWLKDWDGMFHCPFYGLPRRQHVPMVVTIHDVTFETHPEFFTGGRLRAFRFQARHAARTAARILTVAECIRNDITEQYGVDPARIVVAPNAVDPAILAVTTEDARRRRDDLGLPAEYVLALGGARRRQVEVAIEAWHPLSARIPLVTVGPGGPGAVTVALPWLDTPDWAAVLGGATVLLYPTAYESFGMPSLEAAALGVPSICAPIGGLPETLGSAAAWIDAPTAANVRERLESLLDDTAEHRQLAAAAAAHADRWPGWQQVAASIAGVYGDVAD